MSVRVASAAVFWTKNLLADAKLAFFFIILAVIWQFVFVSATIVGVLFVIGGVFFGVGGAFFHFGVV